MRLALFGATGGTGNRIIEQAVAAGDKVTVLARRPESLGELAAQVDVVVGDALDPAAVRRTVTGSEAVLSALGIGMKRHATTLYSQGTANIIAAMGEEGVRRLLVVSTTSLEIPSPRQFGEHVVAKYLLHPILRKPYSDMALMEKNVRESELDWTIVRAARLTDGPMTGTYRTAVDRKLTGCWSTSRSDLAHYLRTHVADHTTFRSVVEMAK